MLLLPSKLLVFLIFVALSGILIFALFFTNKVTGELVKVSVNAELLYEPLDNEDTFLSFLELTDNCGSRIRDIFVAAFYDWDNIRQNKPVYTNGCYTNLKELSKKALDIFVDGSYKIFLIKNNEEFTLIEKGEITKTTEFSDLKIILPEGELKILFYSDVK